MFRSKRPDRLKILVFDGTEMWLMTKWLEIEGGRFAWPPVSDGKMMLSATQLAMLLDGLSEWLKIAPRPAKRPYKNSLKRLVLLVFQGYLR